MNHTPGPWEVALDSRSRAVIVHHQGKSIATVRGKNAENDAAFIASAPGLHAALVESRNNDRIAMSYLQEVRDIVGGNDFPEMVRNIQEILEALEKVIKLAWRDHKYEEEQLLLEQTEELILKAKGIQS